MDLTVKLREGVRPRHRFGTPSANHPPWPLARTHPRRGWRSSGRCAVTRYRTSLHGWVRVRGSRPADRPAPSVVSRITSYSSDFQSLLRPQRLSLSRTEGGIGTLYYCMLSISLLLYALCSLDFYIVFGGISGAYRIWPSVCRESWGP